MGEKWGKMGTGTVFYMMLIDAKKIKVFPGFCR